MYRKFSTLPGILLFSCSFFVFSSCKKEEAPALPLVVKPDLVFYGITGTNQLVQYNANASGTISATINLTGLPAGEKILAIDFRPATGQLYGVGTSSRLYTFNLNSGAATALGTAAFTPAISGSLVGFDFNPTVDRIRLVTSAGQNLRLHPETGAVVATDGSLNPGSPAVVACAYTNSIAGASSTTLFTIDLATQKLYKQDPPNNGTLVEVGSLNITSGNESGFDISPDNGIALASFNVGAGTALYQIDLTTGKATSLGNLQIPVIGLAIPTNPVAYSIENSTNNLLIFNPNSPGTPVSKSITGLQAGETILGLDIRPLTGQLYALGSSSRLYAINMSNGAASAIGSQFSTLLSGTDFGFDFNPTVDRIRVISNTGQNLRLHPETAAVAAVDGNLNPGSPSVSAAAYTNNFPGSTTTVLFDIDYITDKLYTQIPPNNGTLVEVGNTGINTESANGFDIGGTSNNAFAILTTGTATKIYRINLTTGAATTIADLPTGCRALAIGTGF
jgi:Domain of unknown function (DUF4394)